MDIVINNTCIEVQHSNITEDYILYKSTKYSKNNGIKNIYWILDWVYIKLKDKNCN